MTLYSIGILWFVLYVLDDSMLITQTETQG